MKRLSSWIAPIAILIVVTVPILVLVGWYIDNVTLTRVFPQFTPMNPVSATLFFLASVSLTCIEYGKKPWAKYIVRLVGAVMAFVGIAMLVKYVFDYDIFIDRILFEPKLGINRMALTTSINFLLLGSIFVFRPKFKTILQFVKIIIFGISVYALLAYLYNFVGVYGKTIFNPMAFHTASLFAVISFYLFVNQGMWDGAVANFLRKKNILTPTTLVSIFLTFIILAGGVALLIEGNIRSQSGLRFDSQVNQITSFVQSRMNLYIDATSFGIQGLFAASKSVEKEEWDAFIRQIDVPAHYSGISGISFAPKVLQKDVKKYPFEIHPYTEKEFYFPITYVSSFTNSTTTNFGFDLGSETERNKALSLAVDNDQTIATPVVLGVTQKIPVFSVYSPIYINDVPHTNLDERRQNTQGVISVSFRLEKIFPDLFANNPLLTDKIDLEIFDPNSAEPSALYDTNTESLHGKNTDLSKTTKVSIANREWTLKFASDSKINLSFIERNSRGIIMGLGLLFAGLMTLFAWYYIRSREKVLMSKNVQLETLVHNFPYGLIIEDQTRKVVLANQKISEIFTVIKNPKDVLNMTIFQAAPIIKAIVKDYDEFMKNDAEIISKMKAVADQKIELANGKFVSRTYVPLYYDNEYHGCVWIYKDITEEQKIDQMKTEFVSLASHQLRTPLTSINWYVELLQDGKGKLTKDQKGYIEEIKVASERMVELVNSLLNVSRLELGTFAIEPEETDLVALVKDAVHEQEQTFKAKNQELSCVYPDKGVKPMLIDKKITHIIVQNLLSNAHKYTQDGGRVVLSLDLDKNPGFASIICADNGYGIPKAQQDRVFQKLFRADNIRTLDVEGTGLGLYIIKTVVETAGCKISFTSEEKIGTTFTVQIPLSGMTKKMGTKALSTEKES